MCDYFAAELRSVLSYHGHHFLHHCEHTHFRLVFFTNLVVQVAVQRLWECCDTYRMWNLPLSPLERISNLSLSWASANVRNEQDLYGPLDMYSTVSWDNPDEVLLQ